MKLYAPNSRPISSIKLEDGTSSEFKYSYNKEQKTSIFTLPNGSIPAHRPTILLDGAGNEWSAGDVEYHSIFNEN